MSWCAAKNYNYNIYNYDSRVTTVGLFQAARLPASAICTLQLTPAKENHMNKYLIAALAACLSAAAWAENPADVELLSAQKAYQDALKGQTDSQARTTTLQSRLQEAQTRQERAQAEVARLQTELNQADAERQQADSSLQAAGSRLDAAWAAARGAR